MMNEPKYQWSKFVGPDRNEQVVFRTDSFEEFQEKCPHAAALFSSSSSPKPVETPEPSPKLGSGAALKEVEQARTCPIHKVIMKQIDGPYGKFYSHGYKKDDGNWVNCRGQGYLDKDANPST